MYEHGGDDDDDFTLVAVPLQWLQRFYPDPRPIGVGRENKTAGGLVASMMTIMRV